MQFKHLEQLLFVFLIVKLAVYSIWVVEHIYVSLKESIHVEYMLSQQYQTHF